MVSDDEVIFLADKFPGKQAHRLVNEASRHDSEGFLALAVKSRRYLWERLMEILTSIPGLFNLLNRGVSGAVGAIVISSAPYDLRQNDDILFKLLE